MNTKILVIGAGGQVGSELTSSLQNIYGTNHVIASDLAETHQLAETCIYEALNVVNKNRLTEIVEKYKITEIYQLVAMLSAKGEKNPMLGWKLNMESTLNVLELAREKNLDKVFFPSSIAVFGSTTPKHHTPQHTIMEPTTVYGFSKQVSERWCEYYFQKYGVDVRSLRYPGLISYKTLPGGGTTDYAIDIFHKAIEEEKYTCFLKEDTYLPMMYMPDAIRATIELMQAPAKNIKIRSSYNLSAMSFSPAELAQEIQKHIPNFQMDYAPDFRQAIADSWTASIDDSKATEDWAWKPEYNLTKMTEDMLVNIRALREPEIVKV